MAYSRVDHLRVLIVDDFDNFRLALSRMMVDFGVKQINTCGSAQEALALCENNEYDLVLSDYNLGSGKTGQQLLEELRFHSLLSLDTLFVMISAETDRTIVMSTYDYKPDAYLTKPVTTKMLRQRVGRLLQDRDELGDINQAIAGQQFSKAISLLQVLIKEKSGRAIAYQKILAHAYLMNGNYSEAEKEYSNVLEARRLDWAQVGLASIKFFQADYKTAATWLEAIIEQSPHCIEAFDLLVRVYEKMGLQKKRQKALARLVELSPMSVVRQIKLAKSATANYDFSTAVCSYRRALKVGRHSCYQGREHHINYIRASIGVVSLSPLTDEVDSKEVIDILNSLDKDFPAKNAQKKHRQALEAKLLASQFYAHSAKPDEALSLLSDAEQLLALNKPLNLGLRLDFVLALVANNRPKEAQEELSLLLIEYKDDYQALPRIDRLLLEPTMTSHRKTIAHYNKKGIALYQSKKFDQAVRCFKEVLVKFPNHSGIKLNLLQTTVGQLKLTGKSPQLIAQSRLIFNDLCLQLDNNSEQHLRYLQLKSVFTGILG